MVLYAPQVDGGSKCFCVSVGWGGLVGGVGGGVWGGGGIRLLILEVTDSEVSEVGLGRISSRTVQVCCVWK